MAERKIEWTDQQKRAITARGSDILVTASAGTGKTAVLSGRCVGIVSDKNIRPDVLSMLVLTFTNAAAEQMRSRIAEQLKAAFLQAPDPHLRRQLLLLDAADISTIHSFCKRLITEHFYKLSLDPTFRVIESDEQNLLKAEVLEKTIDWAWQQANLRQAFEQLLCRRDLRTNEGFPAKIIDLNNFLDGVVFRENWYEDLTRLTEAANPFTTALGEKQKQIVSKKLQDILNQLQHAQKLCENESANGDWSAKCEQTFIKPIVQCLQLLKAGDWDRCAEQIRNFQEPARFDYKPRGLKGPAAEIIKTITKAAKDTFQELCDLAIINPDYLDKLAGSSSLQTKMLVDLVKKFDRLYTQAKRTLNCLDFADLEHYALKLLTDKNSSEDNLIPSETALALRRKYKYIFVDEYQDINPVQRAILDAVSSGGNLFVVGDVKQSIYAFRAAQPQIFIKDLQSASPDPQNAPNRLRVDLNANFRSAKPILDFVNKVFGRIMTASFANINYDESAKLRPAAPHAPAGDAEPAVELHVLDEPSPSEGLDEQARDAQLHSRYSPRRRQAAMIAQRIREMVGAETGKPEFQIYDKQQGSKRSLEYRDIVILMRSPSKRVNDYVEVLQLAGVPVSCDSAAGYFEKTEISDLICLLKVLDNPARDIELAAVLRSPFFKVSDTQLAKIKLHSRESPQAKNFYDCLLAYCDSGADIKLAEKLKQILSQLKQWQTAARRASLADLIWQICRQTAYLSFVSALPNGRQRRANLLKLHDRAIQFEGFASSIGRASLTRFVEFIQKLQQADQDWASAEPQAQAGNAVRIISVHKSKGLEFPVVFLAELNSRFNKKDSQADCLADATDTLGLRIIDRQSNSKLSSLAHQVIAEQKLSTSLAEEMRILYVATTRARDRLILTASQKRKNCQAAICSGLFFDGRPISDWQLRRCQSHLEWLLHGLSDQKNLHNAFETGLAQRAVDDSLFTVKLYGNAELEKLSEYLDQLKSPQPDRRPPAAKKLRQKQSETDLLSEIKKSLAWRYGFCELSSLPAKTSVSQLTHRSDEYVKFDYSEALARKPRVVLSADLAAAVEPQPIGTATHLVIAQLDLAGPVTCQAVEKTKEKLLINAAVTEAVAERIDTKSIVAFFQSELGRAVLEAYPAVWREWPFTFALPASEFSNSSDETIIVQGIIDILVRTPQGLTVIDFKTDQLTAEQIGQRAKLYRRQLQFYGRAAEAILKEKLLSKWLYFLTPGCAIEV